MTQPHLRAADTDRAAVAAALGEHMAAGRLTVEEYEERVARAYAARTYGDLDALTADLPAPTRGPAAPPAAPAAPFHPVPCASRAMGPGTDSGWRGWFTTGVIVVTIWLITSMASGDLYFWPMWVLGPWGAILLARTLAGAHHGPPRARTAPRTD